MIKKDSPLNNMLKSDTPDMVTWNNTYATGIRQIDDQHRELVKLTNLLFKACLSGSENANTVFKDAMGRMVNYVRFHFCMEQKLLERLNYPGYQEHKKQHETLVFNILEAVKGFDKGVKFVPNHFARTLRDWVFSHIAVFDKGYSIYFHEQIKKGLITEEQIKEGFDGIEVCGTF